MRCWRFSKRGERGELLRQSVSSIEASHGTSDAPRGGVTQLLSDVPF
jgi:hypothetical protein